MKKRMFVGWVSLALLACGPDENEQAPEQVLVFPSHFGNAHEAMLPADNPATAEGVELGRHLFYDPRLSADETVSCASCHRQENAFSDNRARARGIGGAVGPRSSMAVQNLMWVERLFWDGRSGSLEAQAKDPVENPLEMDGDFPTIIDRLGRTDLYPPKFRAAFGSEEITEERILKAIAQFERTLVSHNSRFDQFLRGETNLTEQEMRGYRLFTTHPEPSISLRGGNCGDCHLGPLLAAPPNGFEGFHNNGTQPTFDADADFGLEAQTGRAADRGKFRTPSLRNIAVTAPYMHDGRLATLEDVLDHYNHPDLFDRPNVDLLVREASNDFFDPSSLKLTDEEKADIIAFLHTLTDQEFLTDPKFSDPF